MSTETSLTQEESDLQAALEHAVKGTPLDPEVHRRIKERADAVRKELKKRGRTNVAVVLIREIRDT